MEQNKNDEKYVSDEAQKKAVDFGDGPLLIVAGAGTGKTRTITERIARLIKDKKAEPGEILALTFSEKAASEMEERLDKLVPYGVIETHISTFHSFGRDIINENFAELRIAPDWTVMKGTDAAVFIVENMDEFKLDIYRPLNNPYLYVMEFTSFISKLKDNLIDFGSYIEYALRLEKEARTEEEKEEAQKHRELAFFYRVYEEFKIKQNRMDFGDLIMVPYTLLKDRASIRKKYRERYKYILVDEFQDTNYAQFELLKLITGEKGNITAVGDDDQMIYKFRGAAISNILGFREYYKNSGITVLKNNYRSAQDILDASYKLITNNTQRLENTLDIDKKLSSHYSPAHKISRLNVKIFENYSDEADFISEEIKRFVSKGYYEYGDIAVLTRAKNDAKMLIKTMERKGIPYVFSGDEGLFSKKEVQLLVNFCRILSDPYEFNPLFDIAISDFYKIDPMAMSKIGSRAKEYSAAPYDMMKNMDEYPEIDVSPEERKKIKILTADIDEYLGKVSEKMTAGEIIYDYIKSRMVFEKLLKAGDIGSERKIANIAKFFDIVKHFSINEEYDNIYNFSEYINLIIKSGEDPKEEILDLTENDAVQIVTVHKAKGLEFKVVFIIALSQGKFPAGKRGGASLPLPEGIMKDIVDEDTYMQEEERRLFYVAMTRAQDALYLTASKQYDGKGGKKPSVFLEEIGFHTPAEFEVTADKQARFDFFEKKKEVLERYIPKKQAGPVKLSNYQIDDYITCPFKYKLVHILRIPTKDDYRVMYGQAVHAVTAEYYAARKEGKEPDFEYLKGIFDSLWRNTGFASAAHEKERYDRGIESIRGFIQAENESETLPKYIEKDFEFKLSGDIIVRGRWDRVDEKDGKVTIIDYKTSDVRNEKKAEDKLKSQDITRQLKLYMIAHEKVYGRPADAAGIYFFESAILKTKKFRANTLLDYEKKIFEVAEKIKENKFEATPGAHTCRYCAFFNICPHSRADVRF
ncbi:MAG: ATP-dependent helicase [Candidatus Goldiibacteriota bacterium]